jgi:hypothetical protein
VTAAAAVAAAGASHSIAGVLPAAAAAAPAVAVAAPSEAAAVSGVLPAQVLGSAPCPGSSSSPQQQTQGTAVKKSAAAAARKGPGAAGTKQAGLDREPGVCVVCMDARSCILMLPCRHLCCCGPCFEVLQARSPECPMCRCEVTQHLEVYI